MNLYSEANKYFEEVLKEENAKLNENLKKKKLKESITSRKKLRESIFDTVPSKYFDQISTISNKASRADFIRGIKNLLSNEEKKFLSLIEPNFVDIIVDRFVKDIRREWYNYTDAYLLVKGSRDRDLRWAIYQDGDFSVGLTFEELKKLYDKDPDRFRETTEDITINIPSIKHSLDGETYHSPLESTLWLDLPLARQLKIKREQERKQAEEERKKSYVRGLNKAQNELLQDIKDYIADKEDIVDDLDSIEDTAWQVWDEGDIEIPASYVRSQGGDPDNVDEDIVESYFDDVLWSDKFKRAVLSLYQQLKTAKNESFKYNKSGKKRLKEAEHYNIDDLHFIYTVRALDEDGEVEDSIRSFKNKEDAIKWAKTRNYFVDVCSDVEEELSYDDFLELENSGKIYDVVWTNYESLSDVLKRTIPKHQAELLSYIEQNLKDSGDYYDDHGSVKDIAYYEFVEGRGIDIIIPDAYVLSEEGDPDNVSDDIVDDYFDELWDNRLKKKIEDLLKKYSRK